MKVNIVIEVFQGFLYNVCFSLLITRILVNSMLGSISLSCIYNLLVVQFTYAKILLMLIIYFVILILNVVVVITRMFLYFFTGIYI